MPSRSRYPHPPGPARNRPADPPPPAVRRDRAFGEGVGEG